MSIKAIFHHRYRQLALLTFALCFSHTSHAETDSEITENQSSLTSADKTLATNRIWEENTVDNAFYDNPYRVTLFNPQHGEDSARVVSQTYELVGLGLGAVAVLNALPSEISNWEDRSGRDKPLKKWADNVSQTPVWDRDKFYLNYITHPYFGGVYYQIARKSGYRQWDAFIYSTIMSTFYWEYGFEAFAEVPSAQDLVVSPLLGWVYGEWAFNTERDIRLNQGRVLGSKLAGDISLFFLDPVDSIGRGINRLFNRNIVKAGTAYISFSSANPQADQQQSETQYKLNLSYTLGNGNKAQGAKQNQGLASPVSDPVDTGIVGISAGWTNLELDEKWGLTSTEATRVTLGLYFTRRFSARLSYSSADAEDSRTQSEVKYENYGLAGQYYFNSDAALRPFISLGVSRTVLEEDNDYGQVNGGVGLHYRLNHNWAVQGDWLHFYSDDSHGYDQQLGVNLIYRFGRGEWSL